jgi:hypothetical protein
MSKVIIETHARKSRAVSEKQFHIMLVESMVTFNKKYTYLKSKRS